MALLCPNEARPSRIRSESDAATLPRRRLDRTAIAQARREALVCVAGVDQSIDQPQTDADDHHEEHEQHQVPAPAPVIALFFRQLVHSMHRRARHGLLHLRDQLLERERLGQEVVFLRVRQALLKCVFGIA